MKLATGRAAARLALGLLLGLAPLAAKAQDSPVIVFVSGVRSSDGVVRVDVCTRDTFLKDVCPYSGVAPAQPGVTSVVVPGVPPGLYAVQAYHDRNNNKDVDRGPFGLPKEDLGFSNDAPLRLRGPSFDRAGFNHGDGPQTLQLRLRHF